MKLRSVIFYVHDIEKAKEFYEKIGFNVEKDFGNYVSYNIDDSGVSFALNLSDDELKVPGNQVCSFYVDSIDDEVGRFQTLGIEVIDLKDSSFGKSFHIRDIDGSKLIFMSI